jgi:hypothetical protein
MGLGINAATNAQAQRLSTYGYGYIGALKGANFNSTADQAIPILVSGRYNVDFITVVFASGAPAAAVGGVYNATAKGGTAILPAATAFATLTGATKFLQTTITADLQTGVSTLYLSLTTPAGAAATCDVYIFGTTYDY